LTGEMSDVQRELGIDPNNVNWKDLAVCFSMETNYFYDTYESDGEMAKNIDQVCLSCPIMAQCALMGVENNEWGVWGGIYLTSGKPDKNKNSHKTKDIWDAIRERLGTNTIQ